MTTCWAHSEVKPARIGVEECIFKSSASVSSQELTRNEMRCGSSKQAQRTQNPIPLLSWEQAGLVGAGWLLGLTHKAQPLHGEAMDILSYEPEARVSNECPNFSCSPIYELGMVTTTSLASLG